VETFDVIVVGLGAMGSVRQTPELARFVPRHISGMRYQEVNAHTVGAPEAASERETLAGVG
jgi:hypothetical protein